MPDCASNTEHYQSKLRNFALKAYYAPGWVKFLSQLTELIIAYNRRNCVCSKDLIRRFLVLPRFVFCHKMVNVNEGDFMPLKLYQIKLFVFTDKREF